ncbi:MAG: spore maturation protein [Ignavibacteriales bacterium]|nr:spore maturation protein [Ignavibacteriales bacterium]
MLNYVWIGLVLLGFSAAIFYDARDLTDNTYHNGQKMIVQVQFAGDKNSGDATITIPDSEMRNFSPVNSGQNIVLPALISFNDRKKTGGLYAKADKNWNDYLRKVAKASGKDDDISGNITLISKDSSGIWSAELVLESVSFTKMKEVVSSAFSYAGTAVEIAIGLIGIMAMWLGLMKIAEQANIISYISKGVKPITKFLFPDVPQDNPAIGAIIMNFSANFLGLGNAATPFGLKAMEELDKINPEKGTATNAMCTFLAINTAGMTLIPATAIALRAAAGSANPAIIIGTSIFGSTCATIVGITVAKVMENFPLGKKTLMQVLTEKKWLFITLFSFLSMVGVLGAVGILQSVFNGNSEKIKSVIEIISTFAIPVIIITFLVIGFIKKVKVYEQFVEGAKEGFNIAIRIIPYLVAMLMAISIFRAGGAMEWLIYILRFATDPIGMPSEALPMALMRPLSGSGSLGVMAEIMKVHGPDSFIGILTSTFFGSSETTFYVLAVYFGAVNVKRTRHALAAGLLADLAGVLGALFIVRMLFM